LPVTFETVSAGIAGAWKLGRGVHNWATNAPLRSDYRALLSSLEYRKVLYADWKSESMPAVLVSLSDILKEVRSFRAKHHDNVELGVLLGELIVSLQESLDSLHTYHNSSTVSEMKAYKSLLKVRSNMAQSLAILCGKTGVSPKDSDLEKFILDMALVRPKA
jgi:hypothetical protein